MSKIDDAQKILEALGLPEQQQNLRSSLTLLALAGIENATPWSAAKQFSMSIVGSKAGGGKYPGIMQFINSNYSDIKTYKENSRESFRDETIKPFVQGGICEHNPEEPGLSPNSKNNHYRLTTEVLKVIRSFGTPSFKKELKDFVRISGTLKEKYAKARDLLKVPIKFSNGEEVHFAPGLHNELQAAIIKDFSSYFAHGSSVIYIGDTTDRSARMDKELLLSLSIPIAVNTKLPDVILYDKKKDWLYFIEAVTSDGPMSPQRIIDLEKMLEKCTSGKIYVTAFLNRATFRTHVADIAWETEVWIADNPTHMIHFNGDKFMGPRQQNA